MTPEARVAAAIDVLDQVLAGSPAEKTLTNWGRKNRYAGSKDRAAVRDLVFDALRQKRSSAHLGGSSTGRGLMIGQLRMKGSDPIDVFSGHGYAPSSLSEEEQSYVATPETADDAISFDCQDWLLPHFQQALGDDATQVLMALRGRAPVFLRANHSKCSTNEAIESLAKDEIIGKAHPLSPSAIEVTRNARRLRQSTAFQTGLVELQDAASQAVIDELCAFVPSGKVLDFCAGGGGKSLALAGRGLQVVAYDVDPGRMADIPERARRAGVVVGIATEPTGVFDAVLCDAPCSGSGAWRRQPEAKWRLTPEALETLTKTQDQILEQASSFVGAGGHLAYATCSLLTQENDERIDQFLQRNSNWELCMRRQFTSLDGGDGFYIAVLTRN